MSASSSPRRPRTPELAGHAPSAAARRGAGRRSYGGVAPDERQKLRREKLIAAGIEVFGVHGYHAATVRSVCTAAKLTERYFYESFRSLDELFTAVYAEISSQLKQATLEALANSTPKALNLAEAALRVFLEFVRADPRRARITLIDAVSTGRIGQIAAHEAARDYVGMMRSFVLLLYPDVSHRGINTEMLSAGLVGLNTHVATAWAREDYATPLEDVLRTMLLPYRGLTLLMESGEALPQSDAKRARRGNTPAAGKRARAVKPSGGA